MSVCWCPTYSLFLLQVSLWKRSVAFEVHNADNVQAAGKQLKVIRDKCVEVGIDPRVVLPDLSKYESVKVL